jgi:hypothetical protein
MSLATIIVICLPFVGDARRTQGKLNPLAAFQSRVASGSHLSTRAGLRTPKRSALALMAEKIFEDFQRSQTRSSDSELLPQGGYKNGYSREFDTKSSNSEGSPIIISKPGHEGEVLDNDNVDSTDSKKDDIFDDFQKSQTRSSDSELLPVWGYKNGYHSKSVGAGFSTDSADGAIFDNFQKSQTRSSHSESHSEHLPVKVSKSDHEGKVVNKVVSSESKDGDIFEDFQKSQIRSSDTELLPVKVSKKGSKRKSVAKAASTESKDGDIFENFQKSQIRSSDKELLPVKVFKKDSEHTSITEVAKDEVISSQTTAPDSEFSQVKVSETGSIGEFVKNVVSTESIDGDIFDDFQKSQSRSSDSELLPFWGYKNGYQHKSGKQVASTDSTDEAISEKSPTVSTEFKDADIFDSFQKSQTRSSHSESHSEHLPVKSSTDGYKRKFVNKVVSTDPKDGDIFDNFQKSQTRSSDSELSTAKASKTDATGEFGTESEDGDIFDNFQKSQTRSSDSELLPDGGHKNGYHSKPVGKIVSTKSKAGAIFNDFLKSETAMSRKYLDETAN